MYLHCSRGKQKRHRAVFELGFPTTFVNGFDWTAGLIWDWTNSFTAEQSHLGGICFDTKTKQLFTNEAVIASAIDAVSAVVDNPENITSYTWRRTLPTIAMHANFCKRAARTGRLAGQNHTGTGREHRSDAHPLRRQQLRVVTVGSSPLLENHVLHEGRPHQVPG